MYYAMQHIESNPNTFLPGPEWLTIKSACIKLSLSKDKFLSKVQNGDILSRSIINGPTHYRV